MKKLIETLIIIVLLGVLVFFGKDKLAMFYSNQGFDYYENASYEQAIDSFKKSLTLDPSVSTVHYNLAKAYDRAQLKEEAISEYRKSISLDPSFTWGYEALANIYFEKKLYDKAIAVLQEATANGVHNDEIDPLVNHVSSEYMANLINAAMTAFDNGDKVKARELLSKALQLNPNFALGYYTFGYFYYFEGKLDKAVEKLKKAIQLDPMFLPAHRLLGDIYFEKKDFSKAADAYKVALSINTNDAVLLNNLGICFMNLEDYHKAAKYLEEALNLDPGNINFQYSLASVYRDAGMLKESAEEYKSIINKEPDYPNVHNDLADIYAREGHKEKASRQYKEELDFCLEKLQAKPNDPFLLNGIACAYNGIGEYDKAKIYAKRAIAAKPDYREAYLTLSNIENNLCDFKSSMGALKRANELSPDDPYFIKEAMDNVRQLKFFPTTVIHMKNNRRFEGIIKRQTKDSITLEMDIGSTVGTIRLLRRDITRIVSKEE